MCSLSPTRSRNCFIKITTETWDRHILRDILSWWWLIDLGSVEGVELRNVSFPAVAEFQDNAVREFSCLSRVLRLLIDDRSSMKEKTLSNFINSLTFGVMHT